MSTTGRGAPAGVTGSSRDVAASGRGRAEWGRLASRAVPAVHRTVGGRTGHRRVVDLTGCGCQPPPAPWSPRAHPPRPRRAAWAWASRRSSRPPVCCATRAGRPPSTAGRRRATGRQPAHGARRAAGDGRRPPARRDARAGSRAPPRRCARPRPRRRPCAAALTATRVSRDQHHLRRHPAATPGRRRPRRRSAPRPTSGSAPSSRAVPIEVEATARNLGPGVLGGAGPFDFLRNEGATVTPADRAPTAAEVRDDVFEPVALLQRPDRAATRCRPAAASATPTSPRSSTPTPAGSTSAPTAGRPPNQIDFRTVVLHEIAHGLGITGMASVSTAAGPRSASATSTAAPGCAAASRSTSSPTSRAPRAGRHRRHAAAVAARRLARAALGAHRRLALLVGSERAHRRRAARCGCTRRRCAASRARRGRARRGESPFVEGSSYSHLDERRYPRGTPRRRS